MGEIRIVGQGKHADILIRYARKKSFNENKMGNDTFFKFDISRYYEISLCEISRVDSTSCD